MHLFVDLFFVRKSPSDDAIKSPRNKESIKSPRNKESKVLLKSNSRDGHKIHSHG